MVRAMALRVDGALNRRSFIRFPVGTKFLSFPTPSVSDHKVEKYKRSIHRGNLFMGHTGANRKSSNDLPLKMLSKIGLVGHFLN